MILFERWTRHLFFALLMPVTAVLYGFNGVHAQPSGELHVRHPVDVEPESEGMPERGRFLMNYSYQGEPVEPNVTVTLNGETIASLQALSPTASATLVDLDTEKGDKAVFDITYFDTRATVRLHNSFGSYSAGYWANQFSLNFFMRDEEGNFVKYLGTMTVAFYLFPPFEGFALDAAPGNIAPGEESRLSMESIELPNEPVIIPDNTSVDMRLSPNGKRLGGYAIPLLDAEGVEEIINFPYGFLASVPLYYRAYPDSTLLEGTSEEVQLGVFSHFNTSIAGQTKVEVSVEEDEEYEIFVTSDKEFVFPQKVTGDSESRISVLVLKENNPVSEFPVSIQVKPVISSGGHDHHDDQRPMGMLTNATGETDENGVFTTTFISSEISGVEWIIASSSQISHRDSASIKVEVPSLSNFADIRSEKWRLTGNIGSTSYRKCRDKTILHSINHFGRKELISKLEISLIQFFEWAKTEDTIGDHLTVGVNDMSLPFGGLFDICSDWEPAHSSHRTGIDVDIDSRVFVLGNNESLNLRDEQYRFILEKLVDLMAQNQLYWKPSEGFHFRFE